MNKSDLEEFQSFLNAPSEVPLSLEKGVREMILNRLHPPIGKSLIKLSFVTAFGSFLSLLLCPQFGISITGTDFIMSSLMSIHPALCFLSCGMIWCVTGPILGMSILNFDERRSLKKYNALIYSSFIVLSLLAFGSLGTLKFDSWTALWVLGSSFAVLLAIIFQQTKFPFKIPH